MTEGIIIAVAAIITLAAISRVLYVRWHADRADEFAAADTARISDYEYADAITRDFTYERLYRHSDRHPAEAVPTGVLAPLPPVPSQPVVEIDEYLTGRAIRIIRRAEEERLEWHWDTLTGTWQPPGRLTQSLDFDNWLRELLEDRVAA